MHIGIDDIEVTPVRKFLASSYTPGTKSENVIEKSDRAALNERIGRILGLGKSGRLGDDKLEHKRVTGEEVVVGGGGGGGGVDEEGGEIWRRLLHVVVDGRRDAREENDDGGDAERSGT